ncbi:MAG: cytochrome b/b6 domain-containing protein [Bacteroidales bacterium]|nr:cytochrome b/b6 domain-containing protein [Bacteroidales bacterium]
MKKVYIYNKYNRFWHWTQAALILFLALTGLEVHGTMQIFGYENAVIYHNNAAWSLIVLIVFTIFWDFTIGEWKQYIPTLKLMTDQINYYITGIFKKAPHPTHKTKYTKFNPLQRMTYLGLKMLIIPVMITSGLLYFYFFSNINNGTPLSLDWIAHLHTFGAFILVGFVIVHVYLTTTGHTVTSSIKAMITGWEEMSDEDAKYAIEEGLQVKLNEMKAELKTAQKDELLDNALKHVEEIFGFTHDFSLKKAVDKTGIGYFRINKDGRYEEVNDGWLNMYKCTAIEDVLNKPIALNRDREDIDIVENIFKRVMKGETIQSGEVKRVCKTGEIGYHTFTASPVRDSEGIIVGIEGFIIDTTQQHKIN